MEWYWWVLIVVGVAVIGWAKLMVWGKIKHNMDEKKRQRQALLDD